MLFGICRSAAGTILIVHGPSESTTPGTLLQCMSLEINLDPDIFG